MSLLAEQMQTWSVFCQQFVYCMFSTCVVCGYNLSKASCTFSLRVFVCVGTWEQLGCCCSQGTCEKCFCVTVTSRWAAADDQASVEHLQALASTAPAGVGLYSTCRRWPLQPLQVLACTAPVGVSLYSTCRCWPVQHLQELAYTAPAGVGLYSTCRC